MAQRLSVFPTGRKAEDGGLRDEWLDGGVYSLERGVDYTISDDAFRNRISSDSARRGIMIRTRKTEKGYVIQAFSPGVAGLARTQQQEPVPAAEREETGEASTDQAPGRARGRSAAA